MKTVAATVAMVMCVDLHAQEPAAGPAWNVTVQGGAAYMANTFDWRNEMMSTFVYPVGDVMVGWQTTEEDGPYAALYGYPNFGVGLGWEGLSMLHYHGPSRLKSIVNLYGFTERPLLRGDRVSLDFFFDLGAGFNRAVYDPVDNPLNRNFGSKVLIFVGTGLSFRVALTDRVDAGLSARFDHYSTGRLGYPNAGLNNPSASLSIRYRNARAPRGRHAAPSFDDTPSKFFYELYAGCGLHKCSIEWSAFGVTPAWPIYAFGGSANWRYRPHLSTGVAIDAYAETAAFQARLEQCERKLYGDEAVDAYGPYHRLSGGIGLIQHLHYGNFSAFATVGAYVHRHNGLHDQRGKLYQRIGLKYLLPDPLHLLSDHPHLHPGLFLAADCKVHGFSRAAMMELTVGVRL